MRTEAGSKQLIVGRCGHCSVFFRFCRHLAQATFFLCSLIHFLSFGYVHVDLLFCRFYYFLSDAFFTCVLPPISSVRQMTVH